MSRISFLVSGDAAIYIDQWNVLRQGYLAHNLAALLDRMRGLPADPIRLRTEGGYAFLLWPAGGLHVLLPFVLNAFFTAGFVLATALVVSSLHERRSRGYISALLFVLLFFSQRELAGTLWYLARALRDLPAHLWGMAGLLLCVLAARDARGQHGRALAGGACVGLAAWTRVPDILFAVPAGLTLLLPNRRAGFRSRLLLTLRFGLGCAIGLLPLATQNILEGKALLAPGQAQSLAYRALQEPDAEEEQPRQVHGLHPDNFDETFPSALSKSGRVLDGWFLILAAAALLIGLLSTPLRTLILFSGGLVFFLFYSLYHRAIIRYLFPAHVFLVMLTALPLGTVLGSLLERTPQADRLKQRILLLLAAGSLLMCGVNWKTPGRALQSMRDALDFRNWMRDDFVPSDTFISNRQGIDAWLDAFGPPGAEQTIWHRNETSNAAPERIRSLLQQEHRVFFLTFSNRHQAVTSWWMDDLQNEFDAVPLAVHLDLRQAPIAVAGYAIQNRSRTATFPLPARPADASWLFVHARNLSVTDRFQSVIFTAGTQLVQTVLQAGPNLVRWPESAPAGTVKVHSLHPLPSLSRIEWAGTNAVTISFTEYGDIHSARLMVQPSRLNWRGYEHWYRDWGGSGIEKHASRPILFLEDRSAIRLPLCENPFRARLQVTVFSERPLTRERMKESFRLERKGVVLQPEYDVHAVYSLETGGEIYTADIDLTLSATDPEDAELRCLMASHAAFSIRLDRIELLPAR